MNLVAPCTHLLITSASVAWIAVPLKKHWEHTHYVQSASNEKETHETPRSARLTYELFMDYVGSNYVIANKPQI